MDTSLQLVRFIDVIQLQIVKIMFFSRDYVIIHWFLIK